jgi:hypothetical protein
MLNRSKLLPFLRLLCIVPLAAAGLIASGKAYNFTYRIK